MKRGLFLASGLSAALAGCSAIGTKLNDSPGFHHFLQSAEYLDERAIGTRGRARLYVPKDISADFPIDSLPTPASAVYAALLRDGFDTYTLEVTGAVERTRRFTLAALQRMSTQTQITRHDCVEGWSAIAQWNGVPLRDIVRLARPRSDARYAIFYTFDTDANGTPYYESLDMHQAMHPQALLALRMNGRPMTPDHGGPVRLTVPTQLGYKSAKWIRRIAFAPSLQGIYGGKGGYWEDQGYEWYAGI